MSLTHAAGQVEEGGLKHSGQAMVEVQRARIWQAPLRQQLDYELLPGLNFALAGQREEAVRHFRRWLEAAPENETFREAYDAVSKE